MMIDGKLIAGQIVAGLKTLPKTGKFLSAVLVGNDPASLNFLERKERVARDLDIEFRQYQLPIDITTNDLHAEIEHLATVEDCGGLLLELPLPENINRSYVLNAIPKAKDVDCLSEAALGDFYTEQGMNTPLSVMVVEEILKRQIVDGGLKKNLSECKAIVIGAGFLIGTPVGRWLQDRVGELVTFDITTENVHEKLRDADIVISGAGHAHLFSAEYLKDGAIVIDFGFSRNNEGKIVGDFDSTGANEKNIYYTPTPGGTGPMVIAKLFENFYTLNS